jgi:hypothetical protein
MSSKKKDRPLWASLKDLPRLPSLPPGKLWFDAGEKEEDNGEEKESNEGSELLRDSNAQALSQGAEDAPSREPSA